MLPHFSHPLGASISSGNDTLDYSFFLPYFVSASSPSLVLPRTQAVPAHHFPKAAKLNFPVLLKNPSKVILLLWYELLMPQPDCPLQFGSLCIRESMCGRNGDGCGENSKCDQNCKAPKEKITVQISKKAAANTGKSCSPYTQYKK